MIDNHKEGISMQEEEIRRAVRERYGKIAAQGKAGETVGAVGC